jgi:hypothetical protein
MKTSIRKIRNNRPSPQSYMTTFRADSQKHTAQTLSRNSTLITAILPYQAGAHLLDRRGVPARGAVWDGNSPAEHSGHHGIPASSLPSLLFLTLPFLSCLVPLTTLLNPHLSPQLLLYEWKGSVGCQKARLNVHCHDTANPKTSKYNTPGAMNPKP